MLSVEERLKSAWITKNDDKYERYAKRQYQRMVKRGKQSAGLYVEPIIKRLSRERYLFPCEVENIAQQITQRYGSYNHSASMRGREYLFSCGAYKGDFLTSQVRFSNTQIFKIKKEILDLQKKIIDQNKPLDRNIEIIKILSKVKF